MCHEDDAIMHEVAIMHELQASALCNQDHTSVPHFKRRKLSWACHNCFIAGHMTSDQPDTDVDFKELVGCHVTGNNMY